MRGGSIYHSVLHIPRCKIVSLLCMQQPPGGRSWPKLFSSLTCSPGRGSGFKVLQSDYFQLSQGVRVSTLPVLQFMSTSTKQRTRKAASTVAKKSRSGCQDGTMKTTRTIESVLSGSKSMLLSDAQQNTVENQFLKQLVKIFLIDIETTGFCRKKERIVEFAIRDLSGGENSCFHTLVNPEKHIPNSDIHGITREMVNHPHVPRMKDLIPIIIEFIRSRQKPKGIALLVAHNGHCFDFPFLINAFKSCSVDIPSNWLFLDTRPLAHEWVKSNGSNNYSKVSLEALCKSCEIPAVSQQHRAMADVNVLASIFERFTFDLKLTTSDLLERAVTLPHLINLTGKNRRMT